jgi:hypothetical protein
METSAHGLMSELQCQLESAVAFADLCTYLTDNRVGAEAAELVRLAEVLYAAAVESAG